MKTKLLRVLSLGIILLVTGCNGPKTDPNRSAIELNNLIKKADIEIVLQLIDCSGSGYAYVYDSYTITNELSYFEKLKNSAKSEYLKELISIHLERSKNIVFKDSSMIILAFTGQTTTHKITIYAKPPNPCPGTGSTCINGTKTLSFFSEDSRDTLEVLKNQKAVPGDTAYYDETTKIKTIELEEKIDANPGDKLIIMKKNATKETVAVYTETYSTETGQ